MVDLSEKLLGQRDDDARGASHVAQPIHVLVLSHFTEEFAAERTQASDRVVARHAEDGEKSDGSFEVVDDDADVVQSLDRHVFSITPRPYGAAACRGGRT